MSRDVSAADKTGQNIPKKSSRQERRSYMLKIKKDRKDSALTMVLEGRLDTTTAPQLEEELAASLDGVTDLVFEISNLEDISSAGLRVLLSAQKIMNRQGGMVVRNATDEVMEIFEVTGFSDILTIE